LAATPARSTYTIDFYGDDLITFAVPTDSDSLQINKAIVQSGKISAPGGKVLLTANTTRGVVDQAINMSGIIEASSVGNRAGQIILMGGKQGVVAVSGKLIAQGYGIAAGSAISKIWVLGEKVGIFDGAVIDVSGDAGGEVLIGGDYHGSGDVPTATAVYIAPTAEILANAALYDGGKIIVWSNEATRFYGKAEAKGGSEAGSSGGFVETSSADWLGVGDEAMVDTSAPEGESGTWLLDPDNITIGGSSTTGSFTGSGGSVIWTDTGDPSFLPVSALLAALSGNTNVTVQASMSIIVQDAIDYASYSSHPLSNLYLSAGVAGTIYINNEIIGPLNLYIQAALTDATNPNAVINVHNFTLQSGEWSQVVATLPEFTVSNDFQVVSPASFYRFAGGTGTSISPYIVNDVYGLQGIGTIPASNSYQLGRDIDASSTANWNSGAGFVPISISVANLFGSNHVVSGLTINLPLQDYVGLFSLLAGGNIQDLGLEGVNIVGKDYTGGLSGGTVSGTTISNSYVTGSVRGGSRVGGLVGAVTSGANISNSYSLSNVYGGSTGMYIGGLLGFAQNVNLSQSYAIGNVYGGAGFAGGLVGYAETSALSQVYSGGAVTSDFVGGTDFGGLVGVLYSSTLTDSYSNSAVVAVAASTIGGLVGRASYGTITNVYSSGYVPVGGAASAGGLVGSATYGETTIGNAYWDLQTSGMAVGVGSDPTYEAFGNVIGQNTSNMMQQASYSGFWDFFTVWHVINGESYPYLLWRYPTTPLVVSGTVRDSGMNPLEPLVGSYAINTVNVAAGGANVIVAALGAGDGGLVGKGTYYGLLDADYASGMPILIYPSVSDSVTASAVQGNTLLTTGTSLTLYDIVGATNQVLVDNRVISAPIFSSDLAAAKGNISDVNILYSGGGSSAPNDVTLNSDIPLITTAGTTLHLDGNVTTSGSGGTQTYNGPVIADVGTRALTSDADITFNDTLSVTTSDPSNLSIISGDNVILNGAVNGAYLNLILQSGSASANQINALVGSTDPIASLTVNAGGETLMNAGSIYTTGAQYYGSSVLLGTNVVLTGGGITFASTVNGAGDSLNVTTTGGDIVFNDVVGGGTGLGSLTTSSVGGGDVTQINSSGITTTGAQTYNNAVSLGYTGGGELVTLQGTALTFAQGITSSVVPPGDSLTLNASGDITFGGAVSGLNALTANISSVFKAVKINTTTVSTSGDQTYNAHSVYLGLGLDVTLTGNQINFADYTYVFFGHSLTIQGAINLGSGGAVINVPIQRYMGITNLINDTILPSVMPSSVTDITFGGTLNGNGFNLSLFPSTSVTFSGVINDLASLDVNTGTININTDDITTTASQQYTGNIYLGYTGVGGIVTLQGTDLTFNGPISSTVAYPGNSLNLQSSGRIAFNGAVSGLDDLIVGTLGPGGTSEIDVNTAAISTVNDQTYNGPVILQGSGIHTFTSSDGVVSFAGSVSGVAGNAGLKVAGATKIGGDIDTSTAVVPLGSYDQEYTGAVTLTNNAILRGTDIFFNGDINGAAPYDLDVNASGSVTLKQNVGTGGSLRSLTLEGGGTTYVGGSTVITTGEQDYVNPVVLNNELNISAGSVLFESTITGAGQKLTIDTGSSGDITFGGNVGVAGTPIGDIMIVNANNVTNNGSIYATTFTQQAGSGTTNFGALMYLGSGSGAPGTGTGAASIRTAAALGTIDVGSLAIDITPVATSQVLSFLNSFVNGVSASSGADAVRSVIQILGLPIQQAGTHFFDGIDLYNSQRNDQIEVLPHVITPYNLINGKNVDSSSGLSQYPGFQQPDFDFGSDEGLSTLCITGGAVECDVVD
jgi:hypothetical protein